MSAHITLLCESCGREMSVERASYDPPKATVLVMSACDRCDRGDFESVAYFAQDGSEVTQERPL